MIETVILDLMVTKGIVFVSPSNIELSIGNCVVFEMDGCKQLGLVKKIAKYDKKNLDLPLPEIIRIATADDIKQFEINKEDANKALLDAKRFSKDLALDMNFVEAFYTFDRSQLLLYFLSAERVDFRELAKKIAQKYKTRIELRQIGVRDKAKKIGGLGPCGLFLCCNSFLTDFNSVSINMAKNQFLALNPSKINGVCGRLLCCLDYENETYTLLKKDMPKMGSIVETPNGIGKVVSIDVFRRKYGVDLKEKGIIEFEMEEQKNGKD